MEQHHADVVGQPSGVDVRVWDVPDPIIENTPEAYQRCADTLAERIDDLAKELEGRG